MTSANKNDVLTFDPEISASTTELKRIRKPGDGISTSESVTSVRAVLPEYRRDDLDNFDSIPKPSLVRSDYASSNGIFSGTKNTGSKKTIQPSSKPGGYGYPYMMAPTLPPFVKHMSERREDEAVSKSAVVTTAVIPSRPKIPPIPRMPSMPRVSSEADDDELPKHISSLKKRQGLPYPDGAASTRRGLSPISLDYSSYREPKYRNSYDLEEFSPRRMYQESRQQYNKPSYSFPTLKPRPSVSPRDPYLSPSDDPIDGFYPKVKANGVSTSYSAYGKKDKYYNSVSDPVPPPPRVYDHDDDFSDTSSDEDDFQPGKAGYEKSQEYPDDEPSPYSEPYSEPPPKEPVRAAGGSYDSLYNSPIIGTTRKRLLDYAGASDLYEGEPDYLKSAAVRKNKFASIKDDYHPYPRSHIYSFRDYHFDESRKIPSRSRRQASQHEQTAPACSKNATLFMCLTDADYPTDEVKKAVSKNMKFLAELRNTRLEIYDKKRTERDPESFEDLKKTETVCSSRRGYVYPKTAKDVDGIWRTIMNVDGVKQNIEVEVCGSADVPCDYISTAIKTKCVQKFSILTLITFNRVDNMLESHDFSVPSACSCSVGRPTRIRLE